MESILYFIQEYTGIPGPIQLKLFKSIIIAIIIWILTRVALSMLHRWVSDIKKQYRWRKVIRRVGFILLIILIADLWIVKFKSLATFFGLFSAGLAIALKDPISDLAGWLFIIWRKPFVLSDRIQIDDCKGDVIDIRMFQFTVIEIGNWVDADQSTGRVIHIPNSSVFKNKLANYTAGFQFIWDEMGILVTFESDWKLAKKLLEDVAARHTLSNTEKAREEISNAAKKYLIFYKNLGSKVYTSIEDSGVMLTMRFLVPSKQRRKVQEQIWEDVLEVFSKHEQIDFAYPSIRYYDNRTEGKPPLRAKN